MITRQVILTGTVSESIAITYSRHITGILVPAGWTNTGLQFQGALDNVTWFPLVDRLGAVIEISPTPAALMTLPADLLLGAPFIRLFSVLSQASPRTVAVVIREYP